MKMDQTSTNKKRTQSRCREWERQRRIKFNDAISKLGDIVKSIHKANSNILGDEPDNANYPKIEIVQKAIICLTNIIQEKTQLKAEILALEVKLEAIAKQKENKKDVSLQVTIGLNKKCQNSKYMKMLMLQKSKENNLKEKDKTTVNVTKPRVDKKSLIKSPPKLPKLLPLTNMKKENTIVMLPATPYIFPQRPVLFPQPPTIVLVDTNLQTLSKPTTIPVINRNTNDITRTTMVNVLPISAYSRPLSASKAKKGNKSKSSPKKGGKKSKSIQSIENKISEEKAVDKPIEENNENNNGEISNKTSKENTEISKQSVSDVSKEVTSSKDVKPMTICESNNELTCKNTKENDINKTPNPPKQVESLVNKTSKITSSSLTCSSESIQKDVPINQIDNKCEKIPAEKILDSQFKNKETKLPPIIDASICENVVDGGNARLELAEEFLAASPTAAFLMSFPLVSGNRADSPAEETNNTSNTKESNRRSDITQQVSYFDKSTPSEKIKTSNKPQITTIPNKPIEQQKYGNNQKVAETKASVSISCVTTTENPFLNLPLPSIISSTCNLTDATFGIDFECNVTKTGTSTTTHSNSNNFMYKSDPFNTVKSTIYSTSSISSGHEFNSLGLYPCAMDNYTNKNKSDFTNVEDNLMKINSSRLTYDIDLGWSHKSFDFVNCTTSSNTFHKDTILTTVSTPFSTNYNPFNPDFHVPLVPNSNKKNPIPKTTTFPEQITNFYSQSGNLWSDEVSSIYTNSNASKNFISKQQNYFSVEHLQPNINAKTNAAKSFDTKHISESAVQSNLKPSAIVGQQIPEKYTKKSPSKMHINWMTSEIRPMQNNCNQTTVELKETKIPYSHVEQLPKKQTQNEGNYFPINMHHFPPQPNHEEIQVWPTARPAGTTEISIDPPPINLPTLVGDLALGPHDKKKADMLNRSGPHADLQNCGNFLSVTQLMNRTSENMPQRSNVPISDNQKPIPVKQNLPHIVNDGNRKAIPSRLEPQSHVGYGFNDSKTVNSYENMNQFLQNKTKPPLKPEKNSKAHKNNYSAEALIRGGTNYNQKLQDNVSNKFMMPAQKYNDFNIQDTGVAQVSHFPPIIDYSDNNYTGQQFSGTALYNSTTNTISNSFYSNFMPGSSNLMSGNYTGAPFTSEFVDYNQSMECNYTNPKYNEVKMRNNTTFQQDKETSNYKSSRRESAAKHKLECSKKDSTKKYQSKRPKIANEVEEWNDTSHLLWQNKTPSKRHQNLMSEEITFPNYMSNQMPTQYQPDFFNSHIMPSNMQGVGSNADRSLSSFPVASRANFNLSALFPEITMKVQ